MVLNTSDEEIPQTELAWIKEITQKLRRFSPHRMRRIELPYGGCAIMVQQIPNLLLTNKFSILICLFFFNKVIHESINS